MAAMNGEKSNERTSSNHKVDFVDKPDVETVHQNVQMVSMNQSSRSTKGHYVVMNSRSENGKEVFSVTADGDSNDPKTIWTAWFTLDKNLQQTVILENVAYRDNKANKRYVLSVQKDESSGHYEVKGKKISVIPKTLEEFDDQILFVKKPRAEKSEISVLQSAVNKQGDLLVGFDSSGKPLLLNKDGIYSKNYETYIKIINSM